MAPYRNKEVFDRAGVDAESIKTWDDYYEAAKKIHALGDSYYITSDSDDDGFYDSMVWLAGDIPFKTSSDSIEVTVNLTGDEGVKKFDTFWQKMLDEGLLDTKTTGWTEGWFKAWWMASSLRYLVVLGCLLTLPIPPQMLLVSGVWPRCRLLMVPLPTRKMVVLLWQCCLHPRKRRRLMISLNMPTMVMVWPLASLSPLIRSLWGIPPKMPPLSRIPMVRKWATSVGRNITKFWLMLLRMCRPIIVPAIRSEVKARAMCWVTTLVSVTLVIRSSLIALRLGRKPCRVIAGSKASR